MSKKLLMNNVFMNAIPTCPCCGNLETECICVTLEQLGATELELDFAIASKYAEITYVSSSTTYSYNNKTWRVVTDHISSSALTSFNTKMAELGRINATNGGTDYYGRYISSSAIYIYWNQTDYGTPNIARLNELLALTDEQLEHLKTYGKCVPVCSLCNNEGHIEEDCPYCPLCGNLETECICTTLEQLGVTDVELDFAIASKYANVTFVKNGGWNEDGYNWIGLNDSSMTANARTLYTNKLKQLGRIEGTDYKLKYSSYYRVCWNATLYGEPNITLLNKLMAYTDEQLEQLNTYGKCYMIIINYNQETEPSLPSFMSLTKQSSNAIYGFEHQSYDGGGYGLVSQNYQVSSSNAHGYIAIDTSGTTGTFSVKVTYNLSCQSSSGTDYFRLFLTTSPTCTYSDSGYFGSGYGTSYATTTSTSTSSTVNCGSVYYLHFFYHKNSSSNSGYDRFCIKQIEIMLD